MSTRNEEEINPKGNANQQNLEQKSENNSTSQVLETMRSLIVEINTFKEDNENIKNKEEQKQQLNEILLQNMVENSKSKKS